jgi:protein tyrosine phosphatase
MHLLLKYDLLIFLLIINLYFILIKDLYGHCRYIAAQGPIDESLNDFFHMIWEFQIISIICTANDTEAGRVRIFFL